SRAPPRAGRPVADRPRESPAPPGHRALGGSGGPGGDAVPRRRSAGFLAGGRVAASLPGDRRRICRDPREVREGRDRLAGPGGRGLGGGGGRAGRRGGGGGGG